MEGAWPTRAVLACLAALAFAAPAHASTTIGMAADSETNNCPPSFEYIQGAVPSGGPSYDVPAGGGVITSWMVRGGVADTGMRLKLYRPTAASDTWTAVAETPLKQLTPEVLNTFSTRVSARGGDRIALRVSDDSGGPCWFPNPTTLGPDYQALGFAPTLGYDPPAGTNVTFDNADEQALVNIAAVVEPDADGDGFGDDTQDQCPGVAGSSNGCPPAVPAPPAPAPPAPPAPAPPIAPAPAPPIAPAPPLPLRVKTHVSRVQHVLRQHGIVIVVQPNLASRITGTATVRIAGKVLRFTHATRNVAANRKATLKLKLSKSKLARVKKALRAHRKLFARAVLTAAASGQKPAVKRFKIRLKP